MKVTCVGGDSNCENYVHEKEFDIDEKDFDIGRKMSLDEKRCEDCTLETCPEECFNRHAGSVIALWKLCNSIGVKAVIVEDVIHIDFEAENVG